MRTTKLFTVEETFYVKGQGLILAPEFPIPPAGNLKPFRSFTDKVLVVRPDQSTQEYDAKFQIAEFKMVSGIDEWAVVVMLPNATKADVPIGSQILGSDEIYAMLYGEEA